MIYYIDGVYTENNTHENSNDNNGNVNTNNKDNKSQYKQGGKKSKDTEWN